MASAKAKKDLIKEERELFPIAVVNVVVTAVVLVFFGEAPE